MTAELETVTTPTRSASSMTTIPPAKLNQATRTSSRVQIKKEYALDDDTAISERGDRTSSEETVHRSLTPPVKEEEDSDYEESPEKGKNKRALKAKTAGTMKHKIGKAQDHMPVTPEQCVAVTKTENTPKSGTFSVTSKKIKQAISKTEQAVQFPGMVEDVSFNMDETKDSAVMARQIGGNANYTQHKNEYADRTEHGFDNYGRPFVRPQQITPTVNNSLDDLSRAQLLLLQLQNEDRVITEEEQRMLRPESNSPGRKADEMRVQLQRAERKEQIQNLELWILRQRIESSHSMMGNGELGGYQNPFRASQVQVSQFQDMPRYQSNMGISQLQGSMGNFGGFIDGIVQQQPNHSFRSDISTQASFTNESPFLASSFGDGGHNFMHGRSSFNHGFEHDFIDPSNLNEAPDL
jgi:hypothetical protein